jgi:hypothetical protein
LNPFADDQNLAAERQQALWLLAQIEEARDDVPAALAALEQLHAIGPLQGDPLGDLRWASERARLLSRTDPHDQLRQADSQVRQMVNALEASYRSRRASFDLYELGIGFFVRYLDAAGQRDEAAERLISIRQLYLHIPSPTRHELRRQMDLELRIAQLYGQSDRVLEQLASQSAALALAARIDARSPQHQSEDSDDLSRSIETLSRADMHRRVAFALRRIPERPEWQAEFERDGKLRVDLLDAGSLNHPAETLAADAAEPQADSAAESPSRALERVHLERSRKLYALADRLARTGSSNEDRFAGAQPHRSTALAVQLAATEGLQNVLMRLLNLEAVPPAAAIDASEKLLALQRQLLVPEDPRIYDSQVILGTLYGIERGGRADQAETILNSSIEYFERHQLPERQLRALRALADVVRAGGNLKRAEQLLVSAQALAQRHDLPAATIEKDLLRVQRTIDTRDERYGAAIAKQKRVMELSASDKSQQVNERLNLVDLLLAARRQLIAPNQGMRASAHSTRDADRPIAREVRRQFNEIGAILADEPQADRYASRFGHLQALDHFIANLVSTSSIERRDARALWLALLAQPEISSNEAARADEGRALYYLARLRYLDWSETFDRWRQRIQGSNLSRTIPYNRRLSLYEQRLTNLLATYPPASILDERDGYETRLAKFGSEGTQSERDAQLSELHRLYHSLIKSQALWRSLSDLRSDLVDAYTLENLSSGDFENQLAKQDVNRTLDEAIGLARQAVAILDGPGNSSGPSEGAPMAYAAHCSCAELLMAKMWTFGNNTAKGDVLAETMEHLERAVAIARQAPPRDDSMADLSAASTLIHQLQSPKPPPGLDALWEENHDRVTKLAAAAAVKNPNQTGEN